jgi:hypothetical protein
MSEQKPDNQNNPNSQGPQREDWWEGRREWRHDWGGRDPLRGLFPGLILILLGGLLFLVTRGTLSWGNWWQYFLIGLGGIFLLDGALHYLIPNSRHHGAGKFVPGIILMLVGAAFVIGFSEWWPLILVGVGVAILLGMLFRRR